jgi:hypothetical protein
VQEHELRKFLDLIWGRDTAVVRMATRNKDLRFRTTLYPWPAAEEDVLKFITGNEAAGNEVYFSPDLFKPEALELRKATKDLVLGSRVICLDFDGNAPDSSVWDESGTYEGLPQPSIIIQSSQVDNQHMYWVMDEFVTDIELLENMRRAITYKLKADGSGWDAGQLLRPPFTTNHGYVKGRTQSYDVFIERASDRSYPSSLFTPPKDFAPLLRATIDQTSLPHVAQVLAGHTFVHGFIELFLKSIEDVADRDRSGALMAVAYYGAESDLSDTEIYALVQDADTRWGKYVGRGDRHIRITDLVARARTKYPNGSDKIGLGTGWDGEGDVEAATPTVFSFEEISLAPFDINWFITDLLSVTGYGLFVGTPGVGKTQILIRLGVAVSLGETFLEWAIDPEVGPRRVMMFALEMNAVGVKKFVNDMSDLQEPGLRKRIAENFFIYPQDREIHLDDPKSRLVFEQYLTEYKPGLVIIDSLSKAVRGSLNKDDDVRPVNAYLDKVRRKFGCAIIAVHHAKKRQPGDTSTYDSDTDYVYGSRFITTDADFVLGFEHTQTKDLIKVSYSKVRYGPIKDPFKIRRTNTMNFERTDQDDLTLGKAVDKGGLLGGFYNHVSEPDSTDTSGPDFNEGDAQSF